MTGLSASFVPIMAVLSGQAEQMETQRASVEQMESSLTALLAGERFDWIRRNIISRLTLIKEELNNDNN